MKRGDLATAALPGSYGKARPVLIIQSDLFSDLISLTVLPLTTDLQNPALFRVTIEPTIENGLQFRSQVMADKAHTMPVKKVGRIFGRLSDNDLANVNRALAIFFGLAEGLENARS